MTPGFVLFGGRCSGRSDLVQRRPGLRVRREKSPFAQLDGLHVHPISQHAQGLGDRRTHFHDVFEFIALAGGQGQADRAQRDQQS